MHDDQISITPEQVAALVADQLPSLADLEIVPVAGAGTVNAIFRIGDDVATRFPLRPDDPHRLHARLRQEMEASAELRLACPVPAPEPLHLGNPGHGYPLPWTTQTWLAGSTATPTSCANSPDLAFGLAEVVEHLRRSDARGRRFRGKGRGGVLADHDRWVGECIRHSDGLLDTDAMRSMWSRFRLLPNEAPDAMCHGDLIPSNVLVEDGHLTGVLDTGGFGAADPALDLVGAWHLLDDVRRDVFRARLGCGDLEWERGKAWAFQQAAGAYWYYRHSNPAMADMGRTTLDRLIADDQQS